MTASLTKAQTLALKAIRRDRLKDRPDLAEEKTEGDTLIYWFYNDFSEIRITPTEIRVTGPDGADDSLMSDAAEYCLFEYMLDPDALKAFCEAARDTGFDPDMEYDSTCERPFGHREGRGSGDDIEIYRFSDGSEIRFQDGDDRPEIH
jgi:hypothetical protein